MPKAWLYVLCCEAKNSKSWYYVGETERLFRRMCEHAKGSGSIATSSFKYRKLVGLYCIGDSEDISKNERRKQEDDLTLQIMKLQDNPYRVRGGKWTSHGITRDFVPPIKELKEICMPVICNCKLPAKKKGNNYVCALSDATWIDCDNDNWPLNPIELCTFNVNQKFAKVEDNPNFCLSCEIPCGKFSKCFSCKQK
jgi:hypothetical protein